MNTSKKINQIVGDLKSFLLKEKDAPCSADTHLNSALFTIIESMNDLELEEIYQNEGQGYDAILEISLYRYGSLEKIPEKYKKFFSPPAEEITPVTIKGHIRASITRPPLCLDFDE